MKKTFTGNCICGHSWEDHHHGCVVRTDLLKKRGELYRMVNGCLGDECEVYPPCNCIIYEDTGWI